MFFYSGPYNLDKTLILPEIESQHAIKVLRYQKGKVIEILDGKGSKFSAEIIVAHPKKCEVKILNVETQEKANAQIYIALANLKKRDRVEWFIEKAVELGASGVILFKGDHTEKLQIDAERCQKIAVSALKQSGNFWLPEFHIYTSLKMLLDKNDIKNIFIAHCETDKTQLLKNACRKGEDALVLIGPEGDFSKTEIDLALSENCIPVNLGPLRLRAETAALTALLTLQVVNM